MRMSSSFRLRSASSRFPPILKRDGAGTLLPGRLGLGWLRSRRSEDSSTAAV